MNPVFARRPTPQPSRDQDDESSKAPLRRRARWAGAMASDDGVISPRQSYSWEIQKTSTPPRSSGLVPRPRHKPAALRPFLRPPTSDLRGSCSRDRPIRPSNSLNPDLHLNFPARRRMDELCCLLAQRQRIMKSKFTPSKPKKAVVAIKDLKPRKDAKGGRKQGVTPKE